MSMQASVPESSISADKPAANCAKVDNSSLHSDCQKLAHTRYDASPTTRRFSVRLECTWQPLSSFGVQACTVVSADAPTTPFTPRIFLIRSRRSCLVRSDSKTICHYPTSEGCYGRPPISLGLIRLYESQHLHAYSEEQVMR